MIVTFSTTPQRKKPKLGDTKEVKGIKYVRDYEYAKDQRGNIIGRVVSNGKPRWNWVLEKDYKR